MAKVKVTSSQVPTRRAKPALTPEAREQQMISYAIDLAEQQLLDGTASSQLITHYLKLATTRERLEQKRIEQEIELQKAKTKAIDNAEESRVLYENAIKAMREYSGYGRSEDDEDEY